jgi:uncharacterized tellurite resistance protein B-like protein
VPDKSTLRDLLTGITEAMSSTASPDDPSVLQALLLAAHAATAAADGTAAEDWASYAGAIQHAVQALQVDLGDTTALTHRAPAAGPDSHELRQAATELVQHLADLYATAAADAVGSRHCRTIWARVAHYLNDAAAELA